MSHNKQKTIMSAVPVSSVATEVQTTITRLF